jgi:hypothetical protein
VPDGDDVCIRQLKGLRAWWYKRSYRGRLKDSNDLEAGQWGSGLQGEGHPSCATIRIEAKNGHDIGEKVESIFEICRG